VIFNGRLGEIKRPTNDFVVLALHQQRENVQLSARRTSEASLVLLQSEGHSHSWLAFE
jgi:hypothetical protein